MPKFRLNRRYVISELLKQREDTLVVNGLGGTCWDIASFGHYVFIFYVWGGLRFACLIGLGLSFSKAKKKVIVITGDGEMLMGIGSLATIALKQPKNLSIVVFDNELYGETGSQKTHTAYSTNLSKIAIGSGIINSSIITTKEDLLLLCSKIHQIKNLSFSVIKINQEQEEIVLPIREGAYIKSRFRKALLGEKILLE